AYLKLIQNPNDLVSLQRVINTPRRGIGKTSLMQLNACVAETSLPVLKIMSQARKYSSIPAEAASSMEVFSALLGDFQGRFEKGNLGEVFRELLDELGYLRFLEQQSGDVKSREKRIQVVQELLRGAQRYAEDHPENQLGDYLERMMLFSENDDQDGSTSQALTLMTLHSAKGLEFPYVYMVGMSEGLFPNPRALDDDAEEEERRLCYVGITRAQRELVFSMAKTRKRYQETLLQEPSRFLMELDPKLFSTPVIGEASLEQKGKMKKRSRSDFFQNLKQFNSQS
ncbi:MAG: 3'-5' exonuclease, partial [SAR324 cluster bacterium]|nr:3'-5' exonuclease [SAR324 cluster bacterium]